MILKPLSIWAGLFALVAFGQKPVTIRMAGDPPVFYVESSSILPRLASPNLEAAFQVRVDKPDAPPIAGTHAMESGVLVFRPKYAIEPGITYRATYQLASEKAFATFKHERPKPPRTTFVERVFPSVSVVPDNLLKLYVHFSGAMSRGEAVKRVKLIEDGGGEVKLPFLELDEELWDRDFKRLTVLFDPGRIKRGLVPNQEVGPALKPGKSYKLVVDSDWKDAAGVELKSRFEKSFQVTEADRIPIDPAKWKVISPGPGTSQPLILDFPEPLDAALLLRFLDVNDLKGEPVSGKITLDRNESRWIFTPERNWVAGKYSIEILKDLEDLAGNKVGRPFDVDRFEQVQTGPVSETYSLSFTVGTPAAPATPTPK